MTTKDQIMQAYENQGTNSVNVEHKRSGIVYSLDRGVVEFTDNNYVYGERVTPVKLAHCRRRPNTTVWFMLKSVNLI